MIVNILSAMGAYPVELGDQLTINDLPQRIQLEGGIVVPFQEEGSAARPSRLFIPASQIQGITWVIEEPVIVEDAEVADVSYIGEEEPTIGPVTGDKGINGELFIDS